MNLISEEEEKVRHQTTVRRHAIMVKDNTEQIKNAFGRSLYPPYRCNGYHYHHLALLIVEGDTNTQVLYHIHRSFETHRSTYEKYEPIVDIDEADRTFIGLTRLTTRDMDSYILHNMNSVPFPGTRKTRDTPECCHDWSWLTAKMLSLAKGSCPTHTNRVYLVNLSSQSPIQTMEHFVAFLWGF